MTWRLEHADCVEAMRGMEEASVDAIVTDPPYGLEFMGKEWDTLDHGLPQENVWKGRRGKGGSSIGTDDSRPGSRHHVALGVGKRHQFKRCQNCGKRQFSGSPCECSDPEWAVETPDGPPSSSIRAQRWHQAWATEALRVLKPGGHLLAFGGTRTYHRLACAVEDAGFEIRDSVIWLYGSGFPKSLDVSKAIDKAVRGVPQGGTDPTSVNHGKYRTQATEGKRGEGDAGQGYGAGPGQFMAEAGDRDDRELTLEAEQWDGWGTALKPAHEPIVVARKPLIGTVAENVQAHGTGALNIAATRIGTASRPLREPKGENGNIYGAGLEGGLAVGETSDGRWPANVVLSHLPECEQVGTRRVKSSDARKADGTKSGESPNLYGDAWALERSESPPTYNDADGTEEVPAYRCAKNCPVAELDRQSGETISPLTVTRGVTGSSRTMSGGVKGRQEGVPCYGDTGGASRFFYVAKASRAERNEGLEGLPVKSSGTMQDDSYKWERDGKGNAINLNTRAANHHPTVKPVDLMRWLCRLVTPPVGTVLDPFAGSGTTGIAAVLEDFDFIGIEREAEYVEIAKARIDWWAKQPKQLTLGA